MTDIATICLTFLGSALLAFFFDWSKLDPRPSSTEADRTRREVSELADHYNRLSAELHLLETSVVALREQNVRVHDALDTHRRETNDRMFALERQMTSNTKLVEDHDAKVAIEMERLKEERSMLVQASRSRS